MYLFCFPPYDHRLVRTHTEYHMKFDNHENGPPFLCARKVFKAGQIKYVIGHQSGDLESKATFA